MAVRKTNNENDCNNGEVDTPGNNDNVTEDYGSLDTQLDEINSFLDQLEQKNDTIQNQLRELLKSNIEIHKLIKQENVQNGK